MKKRSVQTFLLLILMPVTPLNAEVLKADNEYARICNMFADNALELHQKLIDEKDVKIVKSTGGYHGNPNFYAEEKFIDKKNGKVISIVTWELENPENLHTIEVFVRDDKGRVIRDYAAAYLPTYRNAPTQTLVSLHQYNDKLHAFRTFDAIGDRILDRCTGTLNGKEVNLMVDEDELIEAMHGYSDVMQDPEYKACFKGLPEKAGDYLTPQ